MIPTLFQIFGLLLFEKYEKAATLLERSVVESKAKVHSFVVS